MQRSWDMPRKSLEVTPRTKKLSIVMYLGDVKKDKAFENSAAVLFLGEIPNMPGHCAVVTRSGLVLWGYHLDSFRLATEDEV